MNDTMPERQIGRTELNVMAIPSRDNHSLRMQNTEPDLTTDATKHVPFFGGEGLHESSKVKIINMDRKQAKELIQKHDIPRSTVANLRRRLVVRPKRMVE